jgi:hypothetical protein
VVASFNILIQYRYFLNLIEHRHFFKPYSAPALLEKVETDSALAAAKVTYSAALNPFCLPFNALYWYF